MFCDRLSLKECLRYLVFHLMREYSMRGLLLQVEDFDISASVPVSYFYSRGKKHKWTAGSYCNWCISGKVTICAQGNPHDFCVRNIQMLNIICCVPVCHAVVCSVSFADYTVVKLWGLSLPFSELRRCAHTLQRIWKFNKKEITDKQVCPASACKL